MDRSKAGFLLITTWAILAAACSGSAGPVPAAQLAAPQSTVVPEMALSSTSTAIPFATPTQTTVPLVIATSTASPLMPPTPARTLAQTSTAEPTLTPTPTAVATLAPPTPIPTPVLLPITSDEAEAAVKGYLSSLVGMIEDEKVRDFYWRLINTSAKTSFTSGEPVQRDALLWTVPTRGVYLLPTGGLQVTLADWDVKVTENGLSVLPASQGTFFSNEQVARDLEMELRNPTAASYDLAGMVFWAESTCRVLAEADEFSIEKINERWANNTVTDGLAQFIRELLLLQLDLISDTPRKEGIIIQQKFLEYLRELTTSYSHLSDYAFAGELSYFEDAKKALIKANRARAEANDLLTKWQNRHGLTFSPLLDAKARFYC